MKQKKKCSYIATEPSLHTNVSSATRIDIGPKIASMMSSEKPSNKQPILPKAEKTKENYIIENSSKLIIVKSMKRQKDTALFE